MADLNVVEYIKKARAAGQKDLDIKNNLLNNQWLESEINDAFLAGGQMQNQNMPDAESQFQPKQTEAQNNLQTQYAQSNAAQTRQGRRFNLKILLIVIFLVVILSLTGGAGFYFRNQILDYATSLFFKPSPESVIRKAWENLNTIKSQNFEGQLLITGKNIADNNQSYNFNFNFSVSGGVDTFDKTNVLSNIKGSLLAVISSEIGNQYNFSIDAEEKSVGKDFYLKIDKLDLGNLNMFLLMAGIDTSEIKGKWFKFTREEGIETATEYAKVSSSQIEKEQIEKDFKEMLDKVVKILLDKKVYDINQLADNKGSEGKEYHYYVSLNQEKLIAASPEIFDEINALRDKFYPEEKNSPEYTLEDFQKDINEFFDKFGTLATDLYIGKKDGFLHKIEFNKEYDVSKISDGQSSGTLGVSYKLSQTDINKPLQISAPDDYIDLKDFAILNEVKSYMKQISFAAESIFNLNKSYSSLCAKGLLNGYQKTFGSSLIKWNNSIIGAGAGKPACFASVDNYCISTKLTDGSWLCIGKGNVAGKTECVSAQTICQ